MTIPTNNWCPTCQLVVHDHQVICTICGDSLGPLPSTSSSSLSLTDGVRLIPEFMIDDVRQAGRDVRTMLSSLRGQMHDIHEDDGWQAIPPDVLAPQNTEHHGRPTAKDVLSKIPRIILDEKSSILRQSSLELSSLLVASGLNWTCTCIPAEFGPTQAFQVDNSAVIVASPLTAKGGLSENTKSQIQKSSNPIVYLERGDGITFVNKAFQAESAGAVAVVVGNNMSTPWPYVMKDSVGEAQQCGLTIPVVMIKQADGKALMEYHKKYASSSDPGSVVASLRVQSLTKECAVCCDNFGIKETVMCLPSCGHVFHEKCVMAWLTAHNTCPFCRRELPTDDLHYEQERRRSQRTHAGSSSGSNELQWSGYYG